MVTPTGSYFAHFSRKESWIAPASSHGSRRSDVRVCAHKQAGNEEEEEGEPKAAAL